MATRDYDIDGNIMDNYETTLGHINLFQPKPNAWANFTKTNEAMEEAIRKVMLSMDSFQVPTLSFVDTPVDKNAKISVISPAPIILKGEIRVNKHNGIKAIIIDVRPTRHHPNEEWVVEYDYIVPYVMNGCILHTSDFAGIWQKPYWPLHARVWDFNGEGQDMTDGRSIIKEQIWATTLGCFKVVAVYTGKDVENQVYLKCLTSIHPFYKVGEVYWEYPSYIESKYRLITKKEIEQ